VTVLDNTVIQLPSLLRVATSLKHSPARVLIWIATLFLSLGVVRSTTLRGQQQPPKCDIKEWPCYLANVNTLDDQLWTWLSRLESPRATWKPNYTSISDYRKSTGVLRRQLMLQVGALPPRVEGTPLERKELFRNNSYTLEYVRLTSRLRPASLEGYLARPTEQIESDRATPAIVLLQGAEAPPETAFGWQGPVDEDHRRYLANSPLFEVGLRLVEAGYAVFAPLLSNDEHMATWQFQRWASPKFHMFNWFEIDIWGAALRRKTGGGAYGILIPQVMTAIDFLTRETTIDSNRIGTMGWFQGGQLAMLAAGLDERIATVVNLGPCVDKRSLRKDAELMRYDAAFAMIDGTFGQVEQAALMAPRPLLFSYATSDPTLEIYGPHVSDRIFRDIKTLYDKLGRSSLVARSIVATQAEAAGRTPVKWLNKIFNHRDRPSPDSGMAPPPPAWKYPSAFHDAQRLGLRRYLAALPSHDSPVQTVDVSSLQAFQISVAPLRSAFVRTLAGTIRPRRPTVMIDRQVVSDNPAYLLEWVRFRAREDDIDTAGYLATPRNAITPTPAVLQLNGNDGLGFVFGIHTESAPYLNAVGDELARRGFVVFVPYTSLWFDGWGAVLHAKTANARSIWSYLLPHYLGALDFLCDQKAVDTSKIAAHGLSFGGIAALFTAAADQRIAALIYSNALFDSVAATQDPDGILAPGWLADASPFIQLAEQYLIAPRRFIWENGSRDQNAFQNSDLQVVKAVQAVYQKLEVTSRFDFVRHDGGHETRLSGLPAFF